MQNERQFNVTLDLLIAVCAVFLPFIYSRVLFKKESMQ
jgi:hypothetical protein